MNDLFLGVDGGQSGTTVVIGDAQGRIAGWASGGPCNHVAESEARARFLEVMRECVGQAAQRAGIAGGPPWTFHAACLGMSGGPDDKAALLGELIGADHMIVTHDAAIALEGALSGEPGIIVIAGTGSIAYGRNERGETARVGGWGYIFGDEGSAFDIVRQALRAVLREYEGWGVRTALTPALLELAGANDVNDLLHRFYTPDWPRARVAALATAISGLADSGDPMAVEIMNQSARQLALLAGSVRRQLWAEGDVVQVSTTGGVFNSGVLLDRFRILIQLAEGTCEPPRHGPAIGALLLAYRAAGLDVTPEPLPPA